MNHLKITIHPDSKMGPHYGDTKQFNLVEVVITEMGTKGNRPMVDLVLRDPVTGKQYLAVTTGTLVNGISAVVKGCNLRNHGKEEP